MSDHRDEEDPAEDLAVDESGYIRTSTTKRLKPQPGAQFPKNSKYVVELKLWIRDLLDIKPDPDNVPSQRKLYLFRSTFVHTVNIYGTVCITKYNEFSEWYVVDDGSGKILCWMDRNQLIKMRQIGMPVKERLAKIEQRHADTSTGLNVQNLDTSTCQNVQTARRASASAALLKVSHWLAGQIATKLEANETYVTSFREGDTVQVRGRLDELNGRRCVIVDDIRLVTDVREEVDRRLELGLYYARLYGPKQPP